MVAKVTISPISLVQPLTRSPFLTQVNAWNLVSVRDALSGLENRVAPLLHCLRSQKTSQDEVVEVLVSVDLTISTLQEKQDLKDKLTPPPHPQPQSTPWRSSCNQQGKRGHYARARANRHARTLPNPKAIGPEIEEGAVNQRPLQELFLLSSG